MKERPELLARDNWPLARREEAARAAKRLPAFFARHQIFLRRTGPFGSIGQARPVGQATATPIRGSGARSRGRQAAVPESKRLPHKSQAKPGIAQPLNLGLAVSHLLQPSSHSHRQSETRIVRQQNNMQLERKEKPHR